MKDWIPLLQSFVWPIFIGLLIWLFKSQLESFLITLNEKLKSAHSVAIGKDGLKLSDLNPKEKIDDATPVSDETAIKLQEEVKHSLVEAHRQTEFESASQFYLRHSAIRDPTLDKNNLTYFRLRFWLDADEKKMLDRVDKVIYVLHPTFRNPIREVRSRENEFAMATFAWGEFNLKALVFFKDGRPVLTLERYIDFEIG